MMKYDLDESIEDSDHRLYLAKDRTKVSKPGKYHARPKAERPVDKLASLKAKRCEKLKITDIELAKSIIKNARWSRSVAMAQGRTSKRREERWYFCENCSQGRAKIYHVTTLTDEEYAEMFAASLRGEFSLAA